MAFEELNLENSGLAFFGRVSASISHELKNVLAVINENAGLLEDLVLIARKGDPPDTERLGRLAATVGRQIQRADGILKKMNQFAHTSDHTVEKVDLYATAKFITELCGRLISMDGVTVNIVPPAEPVTIDTHRFYLQNMLWMCIESIMKASGPGVAIRIRFEKSTRGANVRFGVDPVMENGLLEKVVSGGACLAQEYLQAQIVTGGLPGEIQVALPQHIRPPMSVEKEDIRHAD